MAMLASKPSFPAPLGATQYPSNSAAYRSVNNGVYGSPTESEFSDSSRMSDTVKYVFSQSTAIEQGLTECTEIGTNNASASGLSVSTAANMSTFSRVSSSPPWVCCQSGRANGHAGNNITGENLMDMDPATLKEMGVNKIGDRVRIGSQAKLFRTSVYRKTSKRNMNRVRDKHNLISSASH